uniref:Cilia and flagella associated protein 44 n=1 Tax=Eptatretus burgeri TaxID=7764 RepID=A0A8C4R973_EPTBU
MEEEPHSKSPSNTWIKRHVDETENRREGEVCPERPTETPLETSNIAPAAEQHSETKEESSGKEEGLSNDECCGQKENKARLEGSEKQQQEVVQGDAMAPNDSEGMITSFQNDHDIQNGPVTEVAWKTSQERGRNNKEEKVILLEDYFYSEEEIRKKPCNSEDPGIPDNLLKLHHSFGYACGRRCNLHLLDKHTLAFLAGDVIVFLDLRQGHQNYLPSVGGKGVGALAVDSSRKYFAVGEKGQDPVIVIYENQSRRPYRILRGGTWCAYSTLAFSPRGSQLVSVGDEPDFTLTLWEWHTERIVLQTTAFSQSVFRVAFSLDDEGAFITSGSNHIRFWSIAQTFTGLKLQGSLGRFGRLPLSDIEAFIQLPAGKVVSGSEWGNLLVWEGGLIKMEICQKEGHRCHNGSISQLSIDEGEILSVGGDGAIRVWSIEELESAEVEDESGSYELEPMNELVLGKGVKLYSMKCEHDSHLWYAQDAEGGIWKLDLSFSNRSQDPECIFSFHAGAITGLDVSPCADLVATTSTDCSVRVFDIPGKKELYRSQFKQSGTVLTWTPIKAACGNAHILTVGFSDGVLRLLDFSDAQAMQKRDLCLRQAIKPHTASITALQYHPELSILASSGLDQTVFFFNVLEQLEPIGFIDCPAPVSGLQWSPHSHPNSMLLAWCEKSYLVECSCPTSSLTPHPLASSYKLNSLETRTCHVISIKTRIKLEEKLQWKQKCREARKKEREEAEHSMTENYETEMEQAEDDGDDLEEEEEPLVEFADMPSPILSAFYSEPGKVWISMGGHDSGYLYLCTLSCEKESSCEPSAHIRMKNTDHNPIHCITFGFDNLLLCGLSDGTLQAYLLPPPSSSLPTVHGLLGEEPWAIQVNEPPHETLSYAKFSHDGQFLITAGTHGNIFAFSVQVPEELQNAWTCRKSTVDEEVKAETVRRSEVVDRDQKPEDIEDPNVHSLETFQQHREHERQKQMASEKRTAKQQHLAALQKRFFELHAQNDTLPLAAQLSFDDFDLCRGLQEKLRDLFSKQVEQRFQVLSRDQREQIALNKLRKRFKASEEYELIVLHSFDGLYEVSTYCMCSLPEDIRKLLTCTNITQTAENKGQEAGPGGRRPSLFPDGTKGALCEQKQSKDVEEPILHHSEQACKTEAKVESIREHQEERQRQWSKLMAARPDESYEDPNIVAAIQMAKETIQDFRLKTAAEYTIPMKLRITTEKKQAQLQELEILIYEAKKCLNQQVLSLREAKREAIAQLLALQVQLTATAIKLGRTPPNLLPSTSFSLQPDEEPEKRLECSAQQLHQFKMERERAQRKTETERSDGMREFTGFRKDSKSTIPTITERPAEPLTTVITSTDTAGETKAVDLEEERITNNYLYDNIVNKMEKICTEFDAELRLARRDRIQLDAALALANLRLITLFQELQLFRECEKEENSLKAQCNARCLEKAENEVNIEKIVEELKIKQADVDNLEKQLQVIHISFQEAVGDRSTFSDFLLHVFHEHVPQDSPKPKSNKECDPELFDLALFMRNERSNREEELAEQRRVLESLKQKYEAFLEKEKVVNGQLQAAEAEIEAYKHEKQRRLNDFNIAVPLKLHQVEYVSGSGMPADFQQCLLFERVELHKLKAHIGELAAEKTQQIFLHRNARMRHAMLAKELLDMEKKMRELRELCHQEMLFKFGCEVDLDDVMRFGANPTVEELEQKLVAQEHRHSKQRQKNKDMEMKLKEELADVLRRNTKYLHEQRKLLVKRQSFLDAKQVSTVSHEGHIVDPDEIKGLEQLVETQVHEIRELQEVIERLHHKGEILTMRPLVLTSTPATTGSSCKGRLPKISPDVASNACRHHKN